MHFAQRFAGNKRRDKSYRYIELIITRDSNPKQVLILSLGNKKEMF